jgi:hypothetical protein
MVGYVILGIVALFLAVILIRAAMFRPKKQPPVSREAVSRVGGIRNFRQRAGPQRGRTLQGR